MLQVTKSMGIICVWVLYTMLPPIIGSSCQQNSRVFVIDDDFFVFERVLSSHKLEDNQPGTGTGDLADRAHEKVAVEVLAPPACSLGESSALAEGFLVGVVVSGNNARWSVLLVRLEVECLKAAIVDVLDFCQRMHDELRGDGRRNAGQ